jgi:hypothetical protein
MKRGWVNSNAAVFLIHYGGAHVLLEILQTNVKSHKFLFQIHLIPCIITQSRDIKQRGLLVQEHRQPANHKQLNTVGVDHG